MNKIIKAQKEVLKSKKRLSVVPLVRHAGKRNYYRMVNKTNRARKRKVFRRNYIYPVIEGTLFAFIIFALLFLIFVAVPPALN